MNAGRYEVVVAGQVTKQPFHLTYTDELAPRADLTLSGLSGSPGDTLWLQVGWVWSFGDFYWLLWFVASFGVPFLRLTACIFQLLVY